MLWKSNTTDAHHIAPRIGRGTWPKPAVGRECQTRGCHSQGRAEGDPQPAVYLFLEIETSVIIKSAEAEILRLRHILEDTQPVFALVERLKAENAALGMELNITSNYYVLIILQTKTWNNLSIFHPSWPSSWQYPRSDHSKWATGVHIIAKHCSGGNEKLTRLVLRKGDIYFPFQVLVLAKMIRFTMTSGGATMTLRTPWRRTRTWGGFFLFNVDAISSFRLFLGCRVGLIVCWISKSPNRTSTASHSSTLKCPACT